MKKEIPASDDSTVVEIAELMDVSVTEVIRPGFAELGLMLTRDDRPGRWRGK